MKNNQPNWTKEELGIYILLLCSNADSNITDEEFNFMKSKVDTASFNKIYKEFLKNSEEECLEILEDQIHQLHYSHREIIEIKTNMKALFFTDNNYNKKEEYLDRIINNILY